jgi:hypothetical protein
MRACPLQRRRCSTWAAVMVSSRPAWPVVSNATRDWPWALTALACRGVANRVRGKWEHTAPQTWPPPDTLRQLRRSLREALPGARISRLLMGRYLIVWRAPG